MNALVTGGASGLGGEITKAISVQYETVYFTYKTSKEKAQTIENSLSNCKGIQCDFGKPLELKSLCDKIGGLGLNTLINNAWTSLEKKHFHKFDDEHHTLSFQRNVAPTIQITKACLKHFRSKKDGAIITILSSSIINSPPIGWSGYVAEKNYLLSLSKTWAAEYSKYNITSNCISPSMMQTNMTSDMDQRILENIVKSHPRKALLSTTEVADSVVSLLNMTKHVNGINMIINSAEDVI